MITNAVKKLEEDLTHLKFLQSFVVYRSPDLNNPPMKEFHIFGVSEDPDRQYCLATCFRKVQEENFIICYLQVQFDTLDPFNYHEGNVDKTMEELNTEWRYECDPESKAEKHFKMFMLQQAYEAVEKLHEDLKDKFKYRHLMGKNDSGPGHDYGRNCEAFMNGKNRLLKEIREMMDWYRCSLQNLLDRFVGLEATIV